VIASRRWQDWAAALIGAFVAVAPLVFANSRSEPAAYAAYILGALIFVGGALSLIFPRAMLQLGHVVLAVLLFFSPWLVGFTTATAMAWTAWIAGVALLVVVGSLYLKGGQRRGPSGGLMRSAWRSAHTPPAP
jgi:SPW repeat